MKIPVIYLHKRDFNYKSNKGLAEKQVRAHYKSKGYEVFRGSYISFQSKELREFHADKLLRFENAIKEKIGQEGLIELSVFCNKNAGLPDFAVKKDEEFFFVEVKLENEQIKTNQIDTIKFIKKLGLNVIIVRFSSNIKIFEKELDLETRKSINKSYIPKLKLKWKKKK